MYRTLLILAVCFALSATTASAQRKELRRFTNEYSSDAHTFSIGLSFLPLRVVSWFIPARAFDGDARDIKWALKKVRSLRVYTIAGEEVTRESIDLLKEDLYRSKQFEPLVELKRKGANVQVLSQGKDEDRLDHLVVLVQEEEATVMMHLRTKITMKDLSRLVNRLQDEDAIVSLPLSRSPRQASHSQGE
ncbi:DUF4252 domain-containing protein [Chitinophaga sp. XS-30]|uniref:DUF4252 domain-containing protein n=1 Tax=Chitinophaga sp. XS-30 TaxID=2604421 RepID=UPI0011DD4C72|nr:DUF4252 domain-containing protein [Chitinophaga sp. XS-30]QEH42330.1 DUF4252 domain-containing protein [Chitinophaga sp. XS-30]